MRYYSRAAKIGMTCCAENNQLHSYPYYPLMLLTFLHSQPWPEKCHDTSCQKNAVPGVIMYNEFHIRVTLPCKELILKTLLRPPNCHVYQFVYHAWGKIWLMTWVIFDKANQRNVGKGLMYLLPEHVPTWVHENRFPIHVQLKKILTCHLYHSWNKK